ncbi:flagellar motor switch protein FliN [Sinorhizobium garamanticum]|uniref:Flagellar motor switch protein FliN n=1 Tax=Sinorhizobium garamanticum TaxID=680247 RepID=A0ABY8DB58_9HYPH|nr:flagellar motor switch protein FliN [Sinorhizobium garamanticum]WEX88126.1 flagellar motor switch protein FliN [Sinorhizobium garamanticum]
MAPKKAAPIQEQAAFAVEDTELDQAIDDLRGVLKKDGEQATDFGADFGSTGALDMTTEFGGDFGGATDTAGAFGGDFGADSFGGDFAGAGMNGAFNAGGSFGDGGFDAAEPATESAPGSGMTANLDLIMDIPIDVQIVLGTSRMQVSGLMGLSEGATIALDRKIGEPVEIMVNGRVIGRGEITVLEGDVTRFGVKLIEIKGSKKS